MAVTEVSTVNISTQWIWLYYPATSIVKLLIVEHPQDVQPLGVDVKFVPVAWGGCTISR